MEIGHLVPFLAEKKQIANKVRTQNNVRHEKGHAAFATIRTWKPLNEKQFKNVKTIFTLIQQQTKPTSGRKVCESTSMMGHIGNP